MKFAGIIAEYDPFHNGHAWQLAQARALGAQRVAVAMSCGLTQRGALPLLPEAVRVQAALACGADLVFALPAPCACAGAEAFARAGVRILAAAGCDALVFGAENPDTALLQKAARVLCSEAYRTALRQQLAAGARSFAAARQAAVQALCPGAGIAALLDKPNNNLAVEYCKAIIEQNVEMQPIALPRQGADHGQALTESGHAAFASASALRALWAEGGAAALAPYVPEKALKLYKQAEYDGKYTDFAVMGHCELALLRAACAGQAPFAAVRGVSEGLEHRLENAVRETASLPALLDALTTVRYPRARMRRWATPPRPRRCRPICTCWAHARRLCPCPGRRRCRCPTRWRGWHGKTRPAPKWLLPRAEPATLVRCAGQNRSRWAGYIVKKLSF